MTKKIVATLVFLANAFSLFAQKNISLTYSKMIGKNNGAWEKWPDKYQDNLKVDGYTPILTLKKVDDDIFQFSIDFGGSTVLKSNVMYDPKETAAIRKANNSTTLTAYRYSGTNDYVWTDKVTLAELEANPKKWMDVPNAKFYTWEHSLGSATLYTSQLANQAAQKYSTNFKSTSSLIKGTWTNWTNWSSMPKNSYFELKVLLDNRKYSFKYYENGQLVKNYNIIYDDAKTKSLKTSDDMYKNANCYKIEGSKDDWVYLLNTTMGNVFNNPTKWSDDNNAIIYILDDEKSGNFTRIK